MQSLIAFGNKVEGRDKVLKFLQYISRFLRTIVKDKELLGRLNGLFAASSDARKMFRLAKSVNEYDTIARLLASSSTDGTATIIQLLARSFFFIYWIFDNLSILSKIRVVKVDPKTWSKPGMTCWMLGIIFSLILLVRTLLNSYAQENQLRSAPSKSAETTEKLDKLLATRKVTVLNIVKNLGDFIPASTGSELPQKLFHRWFPERWCGFGGALSAAISCYQAWP